MVDDCGDATVGVYLQVLRALLLLLAKIEVHGLIRQPEFLENDSSSPADGIGFQVPMKLGGAVNSPAVDASAVGV